MYMYTYTVRRWEFLQARAPGFVSLSDQSERHNYDPRNDQVATFNDIHALCALIDPCFVKFRHFVGH